MISLNTRLELLVRLGQYMLSDAEEWLQAQESAVIANPWFTRESIDIAVKNIALEYLDESKLRKWLSQYTLPQESKIVGIVMAGNIPLVGFHDLLCGFISGHKLLLKLSSKDEVLIKHILRILLAWQPEIKEHIQASDMLKGCDAYIATGSNNSARYFEQYFAKYPHIIRRNRTSVAVLDGIETDEQLSLLAGDVFTYFGLGCRNVTQIYVPRDYNFEHLLNVFENYSDLMLHHKYKNNYDYHLAIYLLNKVPYMTNGSLLLVENEVPFSAVSVLHYKYYDHKEVIEPNLKASPDIQCIVNIDIPFGFAQKPSIGEYADKIDTLSFLCGI